MTLPSPLLVLDLDGTLVDSAAGLAATANRMLQRRSLPPVTAEQLHPMIGHGLQALAERILLSRGLAPDPRSVSAFTADYNAHPTDAARLFPGIAATLRRAKAAGWRLAVCTNKPARPARSLLEALGIGALFDAVGGGDSFSSRKPDPAHLLGTVALAHGRRDMSVMVGDHRNDVSAARGAGIPMIFAAWGYGGPDMHQGAAAVLADPLDLPETAARLLDAARRRA